MVRDMRWKILAMFLLLMGVTLVSLLIYVTAQPKDFVIPLELPTNRNPNLEQRFIQGSVIVDTIKVQSVSKGVLQNKDFESCFVDHLDTREKIYITWQAVNPDDSNEVFVSVETLPMENLRLLNSVESVEFLFDKQQILVKTKPFWILIIAFSFSLLISAILAGFFICKFKGR